MEYFSAYLLCFLQLSFSALILLLLHSLRKQIGQTPFYLSLATILIFSHFLGPSGLHLNAGALSINVATSLLLSPFIMAMLIVYALNGTIAAQRLTIGAIAMSGTFFYLANITVQQCDWLGFEIAPDVAETLKILLDPGRGDVGAAIGAIIIDLLVLPVTFQFFRNRHCSTYVCVTLSLLLSQVADSFVYSLISNAWAEDFWDYMRQLYLARALSMVWLGGLATIYLRMHGESSEEPHRKSSLDFLRAIFQSYTEHKIVRDHVHEWEGRFELFVENSQDVILLLGKDGCILDGNKTAIKYLGLDVEELQKIYFHNLTVTEDEEVPEYLQAVGKDSIHWTKAWKKLISEEEHTIQEEWLVKDYQQRYISLECSINLLELGNEKFALVTGRNSTSRHKLNIEKKNLMLQLNHSQRLESVGRLAGGIAHDFNNLLHSIQGSLDAITRQPDIEKQEALHSNINHAVAKASVLTSQLLGFARKGKYEVKKVDLSSIMHSAHSLFEPIARKTVKCRLIVHPDPLFAKADSTQLEQVFLNLLINSRDALEDVDTAKIFFRLEPASDYTPGWDQAPQDAMPADYACIRCKDNGEGISPENLKTIFDPFFTTKAIGKGTGMGLAMVYGTIHNHNGWIHVESTLGKGTEFFIFIPLYSHKRENNISNTQLNISI